ncbi:hypothetical protein [Haloechinothrix sp. LS1_15]|uniref:hypothetical protein n=1 Tax=Haloechinothrix sp. LS1_15 TaxID=2652248 RepID=UPI00294823C3|nr:hypothetical protein [Haloechinothrix sp. LS1_15]MDV6013626.1 hypothetical protein [Haloechinothrix sp. LS1_15]
MDALLRELGTLHRARPGIESTSSEVAAWYEAKADVLWRIAATDTTPRQLADRFAGLASLAEKHAERLRHSQADARTS